MVKVLVLKMDVSVGFISELVMLFVFLCFSIYFTYLLITSLNIVMVLPIVILLLLSSRITMHLRDLFRASRRVSTLVNLMKVEGNVLYLEKPLSVVYGLLEVYGYRVTSLGSSYYPSLLTFQPKYVGQVSRIEIEKVREPYIMLFNWVGEGIVKVPCFIVEEPDVRDTMIMIVNPKICEVDLPDRYVRTYLTSSDLVEVYIRPKGVGIEGTINSYTIETSPPDIKIELAVEPELTPSERILIRRIPIYKTTLLELSKVRNRDFTVNVLPPEELVVVTHRKLFTLNKLAKALKVKVGQSFMSGFIQNLKVVITVKSKLLKRRIEVDLLVKPKEFKSEAPAGI